ncbi:hypothetical protein PORY_002640 [Pneumocystis oryctolagi]|uniref:Uncharacterized protein n=1 Tax=Pneumocystis oryctolagi TaxID=42067 RepID=A0ACB7CBX9_9ASCO|nr:hypothetical protein PORY_002640 [Pneumocystis oryctolagi]
MNKECALEIEKKPIFVDHQIFMFEKLYQEFKKEIQNKQRTEIKITLPDGTSLEGISWETTPLEISKRISKSLSERVVVAQVDGVLWDLERPFEKSSVLKLLDFDTPEGKQVFWHSSAHILGEASERYYGCHLCIGPPTEDGFFYEMAIPNRNVLKQDYSDLEKLTKLIIAEKQPFQRLVVTKDNLLEMFKYNDYKKTIILSKVPDDGSSTVYRCGTLVDFCMGPHVPHTGKIKTLSILKNSSSYFLGDVTKDSLQRIYGISFPDNKQMLEYKNFLIEAEKRDHRKIGKEQELFFFHELSPGSCFFLPHGTRIYNRLVEFIKSEYRRRGFSEVITPNVYNSKLWQVSGHWQNYSENMFSFDVEKEQYALKPMNCPGHCLIFSMRDRSYRELPLRYADFGVLHRNEFSGALTGLMRVRRFQQDDAHIFCTFDQVKLKSFIRIYVLYYVYGVFGFSFRLNLSTRPKKFIGDIETWNQAEKSLENALNTFGMPWEMNLGDGAFYGPKVVDIKISDASRRQHQCATIQLDFFLPERFNLEYRLPSDEENQTIYARPVIIHRSILGSVERMIAILIEHYAGKWPFWLSPRQVMIIPISKTFKDYSAHVYDKLYDNGFYVDIDLSDNTLNKMIRNAQIAQYNFIFVIGQEEIDSNTVMVRNRDHSKQTRILLDDVINKLRNLQFIEMGSLKGSALVKSHESRQKRRKSYQKKSQKTSFLKESSIWDVYNNNVDSIFSSILENLDPTKVLVARFNTWRDLLKELIIYFKAVVHVQEIKTTEFKKLGSLLSFNSCNRLSFQDGGVKEVEKIFCEWNNKYSSHLSTIPNSINVDIVSKLEKVRTVLNDSIKDIMKMSGKFRNNLYKEADAAKRLFNTYRDSLLTWEFSPEKITPRTDPYLLRILLEKQITQMLSEENTLQKVYLDIEGYCRKIEKQVIDTVRQVFGQYRDDLQKEVDFVYDFNKNIGIADDSISLDKGWNTFIKEELLIMGACDNSEDFISFRAFRCLGDILYGQNHPAAKEIRSGILERRTKIFKSYSSGFYVLTPSGFLHEFKSDNLSCDQVPIMSLSLRDYEISDHSPANASSYKFSLKGCKHEHSHRVHTWVFRTKTYQELLDWYNDIKKFTGRSYMSDDEFRDYIVGLQIGNIENSQIIHGQNGVSDQERQFSLTLDSDFKNGVDIMTSISTVLYGESKSQTDMECSKSNVDEENKVDLVSSDCGLFDTVSSKQENSEDNVLTDAPVLLDASDACLNDSSNLKDVVVSKSSPSFGRDSLYYSSTDECHCPLESQKFSGSEPELAKQSIDVQKSSNKEDLSCCLLVPSESQTNQSEQQLISSSVPDDQPLCIDVQSRFTEDIEKSVSFNTDSVCVPVDKLDSEKGHSVSLENVEPSVNGKHDSFDSPKVLDNIKSSCLSQESLSKSESQVLDNSELSSLPQESLNRLESQVLDNITSSAVSGNFCSSEKLESNLQEASDNVDSKELSVNAEIPQTSS